MTVADAWESFMDFIYSGAAPFANTQTPNAKPGPPAFSSRRAYECPRCGVMGEGTGRARCWSCGRFVRSTLWKIPVGANHATGQRLQDFDNQGEAHGASAVA